MRGIPLRIRLLVENHSSRPIFFSWCLNLFSGTHNFDMARGNFHGTELSSFPLQFTLILVWLETSHSQGSGHSKMRKENDWRLKFVIKGFKFEMVKSVFLVTKNISFGSNMTVKSQLPRLNVYFTVTMQKLPIKKNEVGSRTDHESEMKTGSKTRTSVELYAGAKIDKLRYSNFN